MIALDTMSLGARSFIFGAYLSMNLSPLAFLRIPPSPLEASVIRMPEGTRPVGWNWTNSMSFSGTPALKAIARPSGVELCPNDANG